MSRRALIVLSVVSLLVSAVTLIAGACIADGHGDVAWLWGTTRYRLYVDEGYFGCDINGNWGYPTAYPKHLTRQFLFEDPDLSIGHYHEFPIPIFPFGFLCAIAPLAWKRRISRPAPIIPPAQPAADALVIDGGRNSWWPLAAFGIGLSGFPLCIVTTFLMSPPGLFLLPEWSLAALVLLFLSKPRWEGTALGSFGFSLALLWAPLILLLSLVFLLMQMQGGGGYNP
ncbi:MAG: hypothetical protein ABSH22_22100 [Tepidisphaeraceae bacterium]|jgi:hypothetical protein